MQRDFAVIPALVLSEDLGPREEQVLAEVGPEGLVYHLGEMREGETFTLSPTLVYHPDGSVTFKGDR